MISKGSSGSYFARAKFDGKVQTVGYVQKNKFYTWNPSYRCVGFLNQRMKNRTVGWILRRQSGFTGNSVGLFLLAEAVWYRIWGQSYSFWGKNPFDQLRHANSYISEAAASLLDARLQLYIVPRTELVTFSSPVSVPLLHSIYCSLNCTTRV